MVVNIKMIHFSKYVKIKAFFDTSELEIHHSNKAYELNFTEKRWYMLDWAKKCWVETIIYACHLISCISLTKIEGKTPIIVWFRIRVNDYASFHIFGFIALFMWNNLS